MPTPHHHGSCSQSDWFKTNRWASCFAMVTWLLSLHHPGTVMGAAVCDDYWHDTIDQQLSPWKDKGIDAEDLTGVMQFKNQGVRDLGTIKVINNKVYLKVVDEMVRIQQYTALLLLPLLCKFKLPDVQFDFEVSGHIYSRGNMLKGRPPVFAYNRHMAYTPDLILVPYQLVAMLGRRQAPLEPWALRKPAVYWRGSTTGATVTVENIMQLPRTQMLVACNELGEVCNAKYSNVVQVKSEAEEARVEEKLGSEGLMADLEPWDVATGYKYLLLPDGNVAPTSRSMKSLEAGAVVLKELSPFEEFWYRKLVPFYNYVPLPMCPSELNRTLTWLQQNDNIAEQIARRGQELAQEHLNVDSLHCYVAQLLSKYAKLLNFNPVYDKDNDDGFRPIEEFLTPKIVRGLGQYARCKPRSLVDMTEAADTTPEVSVNSKTTVKMTRVWRKRRVPAAN